MIELDHSPLGGSGAHRFLTCAGSFLMDRALYEAGEFEQSTSEYAEIGTGAHELGALCLTEDREPFEFMGKQFNGFTVGQEIDPNAVAVYVNECRKIDDLFEGKGTRLIETTIAHPDVHPYLKGTVDYGRWSSKRGLYLRDYKNGGGIGVGAVGNEQLLYYAFLMVLDSPWLKDAPPEFPVNLGIVQPNFYGVFEGAEVWQTTLATVRSFGTYKLLPKMRELVLTQDVDDGDYVPGEHCQFCPVMLECPKMQAAYKKFAAGPEFIDMLTDQELNEFFAERENARRFMNALNDTVKARLVGGGDIPTAKLVEPRTTRVWKPGAEVALKAALGAHAYEPKKVKSPAQIEKMSSRGKELAVEHAFKPDATKLSLAPINDPRPAAVMTPNARVFSDFGKAW